MKKVISFDIWDTILKRKCHPEEIKLHTAYYILLKYNLLLKEKYRDIYMILKLRDEIEANICQENQNKGLDNECRIEDVFTSLQKEIFLTKKADKDITKELLREEIAQEKRNIYINPDILDIFDKYKDLRFYCISDFYMSAEDLQELLDYVELPVKIEKVYSSADFLLNKRSGNLYKKFEEDLGISPAEHIHVGDNEYSDIKVANCLGIETVKMNKTSMQFIPELERGLSYNLDDAKKCDGSMYSRLFNTGLKLAPLLYFYVYSIVEYAIKNNIDTVYYQTREGETFIKIHELIKKNNPFGVKVPECEIIEVSRMSTFAASLNSFSILELMRLWSQYRVQSMETLFKTLAIDIEPYKSYMGKYDIVIKEPIVEPWFDVRVQSLCQDEEFTKKIQSDIDKKRNELLKYFKEKKNIVNDDKEMLVVDIGWRGTIQDNLAYIFSNKKIVGYYLTLYDFYNAQPKNSYKISFLDDKNIRDNEIGSILTLLEWIFNPGTGSVIEFKEGEAIRKAKVKEKSIVSEYIKPMQDGMLSGSEIINDYVKLHPYEARETKIIVYNLIKDIKANPSDELIEAYYKMVFNDTFGGAEYIEKDKRMTFIERINIFKCRDKLRRENWKEAFIKYNNIGYIKFFVGGKKIIRKIVKR